MIFDGALTEALSRLPYRHSCIRLCRKGAIVTMLLERLDIVAVCSFELLKYMEFNINKLDYFVQFYT